MARVRRVRTFVLAQGEVTSGPLFESWSDAADDASLLESFGSASSLTKCSRAAGDWWRQMNRELH
jgi:hypothetical protein